MKNALAFVLSLFVIAGCQKAETGLVLGPEEKDLFDNINQYRRMQGLGTLVFHHVVQAQARHQAQALAAGTAPFSDAGFADRAAAVKAQLRGSDAAELIGRHWAHPADLLTTWSNDPLTRAHLHGNFNTLGVGYALDNAQRPYAVAFLFLAH